MAATQVELEHRVHTLKRMTGLDIWIDYRGTPLRPRLYWKEKDQVAKPLSSRMTKGRLMEWLDAFTIGVNCGFEEGWQANADHIGQGVRALLKDEFDIVRHQSHMTHSKRRFQS